MTYRAANALDNKSEEGGPTVATVTVDRQVHHVFYLDSRRRGTGEYMESSKESSTAHHSEPDRRTVRLTLEMGTSQSCNLLY